MEKIYDSLHIDIWKELAYRIQRLSGSNEEQLNKLIKLLKEVKIYIDEGIAIPDKKEDVGLATLLHEIFMNKDSKRCVSDFYEKIYQLSDLDIKYISYKPLGFPQRREGIVKTSNMLSRGYTDGKFNLCKSTQSTGNMPVYSMQNIHDAKFILDYISRGNNSTELAIATIKSFDCEFPSKEEVMLLDFPKLVSSEQIIPWDDTQPEYRQTYEKFDETQGSYKKRLTRTPSGIYYYKEYRK